MGFRNILSLFRQIGWGFAGIVGIYGVQILVRAKALGYCLPEKSRLGYWDLLRIRIVNESVRGVTLSGPFLAEPATAWFMSKQGVRSSEAVAATISEYVANTLLSFVLTFPAAMLVFLNPHASQELRVTAEALLLGSMAVLAGFVIVVRRRIYVIGAIAGALSQTPGLQRWIGGKLENVRKTEDALFFVLRDRPAALIRLWSWETLANALLVLETYWTMVCMGFALSAKLAFEIEILSKLAYLGSVGATEGGVALLFVVVGFPAAAGFTLSLVKRVRSLVITVIGVAALYLSNPFRH